MKYTRENSQFFVHVYREGLASAFGHDVRFTFEDYEIEVSGPRADPPACTVRATWRATSGVPDCFLQNDVRHPSESIVKHVATITRNAQESILEVKKFPAIEFESTSIAGTSENFTVSGTLTFHGVSRALDVPVRSERGQYIVDGFALDMGDFGVKQFTAALGALRVKQEIKIFAAFASPVEQQQHEQGEEKEKGNE